MLYLPSVRGMGRLPLWAMRLSFALLAFALAAGASFAQTDPPPPPPEPVTSADYLAAAQTLAADFNLVPLVTAAAIIGIMFMLIRRARSAAR